jgi:hypothetical protein
MKVHGPQGNAGGRFLADLRGAHTADPALARTEAPQAAVAPRPPLRFPLKKA